jgi:hypothetical protein
MYFQSPKMTPITSFEYVFVQPLFLQSVAQATLEEIRVPGQARDAISDAKSRALERFLGAAVSSAGHQLPSEHLLLDR